MNSTPPIAGGSNSVAFDPVSIIANGITTIVDSVLGVVAINQQRKAQREVFEQGFVLTGEERAAFYNQFEDRTPIYIVGGLAVLVIFALLILAIKK